MSPLLLSQGCHLKAAMSSHSDTASRSPDGVSRGPALEEWEQKEVLREVVKIPLPEERTLLLGGFPALPYPTTSSCGQERGTHPRTGSMGFQGLLSSLISEWFSSISCSPG